MSKAIFSSSWYRVAALKPRLRSHAEIHRHQYRGQTWYVLQELAMERFYRFSPAGYSVIGLMDGIGTVEEIWQNACTRLGDDAPTQDEMIQLLSQLYQADVLQCDVSPDAAELFQRREEQSRLLWRNRFLSVLAWRFPLLDPERFLQWIQPLPKLVFGWFGALIWLAAITPCAFLLATHWQDLTMDFLDRAFASENLLILWLVFPVVKICHEFGHAFATKAYGGEVHDMGVMMLVLAPVPYVDASSASAFRKKWQRVVVGAGGMLVELFIAAIALVIWLNAQPGIVRTVAFNAIFIASVSTVLFNGNPLLRYDGYYILADLIEIPNLRSRSNSYLFYLAERYLFGSFLAEPPQASPSERVWFVSFGILSFVYRIFVVFAILFYLANKLFNFGAVLAIAAAIVWCLFPLGKGAYFLFTNPRIRSVRGRAIAVSGSILAVLTVFIAFVPMPYRTGAEGVIWIPEESLVRAGTDGFIDRLVASPGSRTTEGTPLFVLTNPTLASQERISASRAKEIEARYIQFLTSEYVKAALALDELNQERSRLKRIREELADLSIRSRTNGTFIVSNPEDLPGRHVRKGELLGYVLEPRTITMRTIVSQATIDLVRSHTYGVAVRLSERIAEPIPAVIKRIVPGASEQLPVKSLGTVGGGQVPIDPTDRQGLTAINKVFQIDLEIPSHSELVNAGGHGYVRFDHGWAPLGVQWYFQIRQTFLSRFNV